MHLTRITPSDQAGSSTQLCHDILARTVKCHIDDWICSCPARFDLKMDADDKAFVAKAARRSGFLHRPSTTIASVFNARARDGAEALNATAVQPLRAARISAPLSLHGVSDPDCKADYPGGSAAQPGEAKHLRCIPCLFSIADVALTWEDPSGTHVASLSIHARDVGKNLE